MDIKQLFRGYRAVSPVIGVILMVAITVILAAVIGTFVLGLGGSLQQQTPQAQFGFDFSSNTEVTVTHETGDTIEFQNLAVKVGGTTVFDGSGVSQTDTDTDLLIDDWDPDTSTNNGWYGDAVSAGDSIDVSAPSDQSGNDVRVIWSSPGGDTSATLGSQDWP